MTKKSVLMLGTRGIPSAYGGFETFVQRLAIYLVSRGWNVTVYCQETSRDKIGEKIWRGIHLVYIPVSKDTALGSIIFDLKSTLHALRREGSILVFGYNTALLSLLYVLANRASIMNMDGLEWRREKWNALQKAWLYFNERCGAWFSDFLIADHPEIKNYLASFVDSKKIMLVPYHTEQVSNPQKKLIESYGISVKNYGLVIARPEPENSILEIVSAFSAQPRGYKLVVLGKYSPETVPYHKQVLKAASDEVIFPGAIYEKPVVDSLRYYSRLYLHGHTVGGTNPSLVEALAAGTPVLAQNNHFNRWVAGPDSHYFKDAKDCEVQLNQLLNNEVELEKMRTAAFSRYKKVFADDGDLAVYEKLIESMIEQEEAIVQTRIS